MSWGGAGAQEARAGGPAAARAGGLLWERRVADSPSVPTLRPQPLGQPWEGAVPAAPPAGSRGRQRHTRAHGFQGPGNTRQALKCLPVVRKILAEEEYY